MKQTMLRLMRLASIALILAGFSGCGPSTRTGEDAKLADALIGRWTGSAIEPPEHTWFEFGAWDVWFSPDGDFSAVVSTGPSNRYQVHLAGAYRLSFGKLYIDQSSLAGKWTVVEKSKDRIEIVSGDMRIALERRFGT